MKDLSLAGSSTIHSVRSWLSKAAQGFHYQAETEKMIKSSGFQIYSPSILLYYPVTTVTVCSIVDLRHSEELVKGVC